MPSRVYGSIFWRNLNRHFPMKLSLTEKFVLLLLPKQKGSRKHKTTWGLVAANELARQKQHKMTDVLALSLIRIHWANQGGKHPIYNLQTLNFGFYCTNFGCRILKEPRRSFSGCDEGWQYGLPFVEIGGF
ncbi:hypothetical protein SDJN03_09854, partial [Cucurbita argyrosperma subsp. sororia]